MAGSPAEFELPKVGGAVPSDLTTLEGLLYPSTYWLTEGDGATRVDRRTVGRIYSEDRGPTVGERRGSWRYSV